MQSKVLLQNVGFQSAQAKKRETEKRETEKPKTKKRERMHNAIDPQQRLASEAPTLICKFLVDLVKTQSPEVVLEEFKWLFIHPANVISSKPRQALRELIFTDDVARFQSLLKRACYILINNWNTKRQYQAMHDLVQLFQDDSIEQETSSPTLQRLRVWLQRFVNSEDYRELKLFAAKHEENLPWNQRYASFLLTSQYANANNPLEQRKAAKVLARNLREQYKFELAMYTARSQRQDVKSQMLYNPTELGDEVFNLVRRVVAKRGFFNHANLANIFVQQAQHLSYREFKQSLQKYLAFSTKHEGLGDSVTAQLAKKLVDLYPERDRDKVDDALTLRTCNRIIEFLTVGKDGKPAPLFINFLAQGQPLTLVMLLLKLILVCKHARTHLESCIAKLIRFHEADPEDECQELIRFLEIYNIAFTVHAENVRYNLVSMRERVSQPQINQNPNAKRIFSQQAAGAKARKSDPW